MLLTGALDFTFLDVSSQLNIIWQRKTSVKCFYSKYHGRRTFFVLNYPLVHLPDFFGFVYIVCLKLYSKQTLFPDFSENKMFFNSACSAQDTDIPCPSCTFFACFSGPSLHSFPVSTGSGLCDGSGSCFLPHSLNASCNCLR